MFAFVMLAESLAAPIWTPKLHNFPRSIFTTWRPRGCHASFVRSLDNICLGSSQNISCSLAQVEVILYSYTKSHAHSCCNVSAFASSAVLTSELFDDVCQQLGCSGGQFTATSSKLEQCKAVASHPNQTGDTIKQIQRLRGGSFAQDTHGFRQS